MIPLSSESSKQNPLSRHYLLIQGTTILAQSDRIEWILDKGVSIVQKQAQYQKKIEPKPHVTATILHSNQDYIYIRWRNDWDIVVWSRVQQDQKAAAPSS